MSDSSPGNSMLVNESLRQQFEALWLAGTPKPLSECLPGSETDEFLPTLEELVHIQLEFAWKTLSVDGERPVPVQILLREFPALGDDDVLLRLLRQEYHCREQANDAPAVDEYRESFPDLDLDRLTTPPGETVGPKASDDTATQATPDDHATLPLPGDSLPGSVAADATLNGPATDAQTLALSADSAGPAPLHDAATIAGEQPPAVSIVDDKNSDTINTETSDSQAVFQPGKQVPGYELLGELGRGGMGVVYRALDTRLKRVVALKMILSGAHAGEQDLRRFQKEAEAVAQLQHPGIVQIHDVGDHDGQPFLSLEFVEGGGLDEKAGGEPQPPDEAAALVEQLARAVHFAHERNIVHRDLKPANVLLTLEGDPKITDFGLAKRLEDDASQTASGSILGTPSYMAPEQAGDKQGAIGPPTDVYALGAILYCLLTGRPPFQSSSVMDTVMQVLEQEPVPPGQLAKGLDRNLETITLKCLQKAPGKRYQTARELAEELERFRKGEPIKARPVGGIERCWRWVKRNPLGATVALLVLALGIGGPLMALQQAGTAQELLDQAYVSDMALTRLAWEEGNIGLVRQLLAKSDDTPEQREFEWRYWKRQSSAEDRIIRVLVKPDARQTLPVGWITFVDNGNAILVSMLMKPKHTAPWHMIDLRSSTAAATSLTTAEMLSGARPLAYNSDRNQLLQATEYSPPPLNSLSAPLRDALQVALAAESRGTATASQGKLLAEYRGPKKTSPLDSLPLRRVTNYSLEPLTSADRTNKASPKKIDSWDHHTAAVFCGALSPDGRLASAGRAEGILTVWHTDRSGEALSLTGHQGIVTCVSFDQSGRILASGAEDSTVRIWDTSSGDEISRFDRHRGYVQSVCVTRDGAKVFSIGSDGFLFAWDSRTGLVHFSRVPDETRTTSLALSPDEKRVATGTRAGIVTLWDTTTGDRIAAFRGHLGPVTSLEFHPDGRWLASGSTDHSVRLWDASASPGSQSLARLQASVAVSDIAFSPDGSRIGLCDEKGNLGICDVESRQWTMRLSGMGRLFRVQFSPDNKSLWACRTGGMLFRVSDAPLRVHMPKQIPLQAGSGSVRFALTPDCRYAVMANDGGKWIHFDVETGEEHSQVNNSLFLLDDLQFSPDGEVLVVANTALRLIDARSGEVLFELEGSQRFQSSAIWKSVVFSPNGNTIIAGATDGQVGLWDRYDGHLVRYFTGQRDPVSDVAVSPNGNRIAACGGDGRIRLWDVKTGQELLVIRAHRRSATVVAFSPDGNLLASGGDNGVVKIWDARPWSANQAKHQVAQRAVRFHRRRHPDSHTDHLAAITDDPFLDDATRSLASRMATRSWNMQTTFRARRELLSLSVSKGILIADAVRILQRSHELSEEVRLRIASVSSTIVEFAPSLNKASWSVATPRESKPAALKTALAQARRAVTLAPRSATFVNTLAVVQYRLGEFAEALRNFDKSIQLRLETTKRPDIIIDLVFTAMCHYRLGDQETAAQFREKVRLQVQGRKIQPASDEARFIKEMDALFAPPNASSDSPQ